MLFISPDTEATQRFAGTALEQMLPVVFEPESPPGSERDLAQRFREQMTTANSLGGDDALYADGSRQQALPRLQPFALPPGATQAATAAIFRDAAPADLPKFCDYAKVRAVKAGANVLAVRGGSLPASGAAPRVLLARQQFGAGLYGSSHDRFALALEDVLAEFQPRSGNVLATIDALLRPPPGAGLRLEKLTQTPTMHATVALRVEGPAGGNAATTVEAVSPDGRRIPLALHETGANAPETGHWETSFTPDAAGHWDVRATGPAQNFARVTFPVLEKGPVAESLDLPPDVEKMRQLAQSTGGALLGDEPVFQDRAPAAGDTPPRRVAPL